MRRRVSFPHMGDYWVPIKVLGEMLDCDVLIPPPITKRTVELGTRYSPEFVCIPFKYNLGNYIEALEAGADVLVQCGGGCRFGYYAEVQEAILRDMGHDFEFIGLTANVNPLSMFRDFHRINPRLTRRRFANGFAIAYQMVRALDETDEVARAGVGFEVEPGSFERLRAALIADLDACRDLREVKQLRRDYLAAFRALPVDKPENPMRVGVVGELYVLMEPFSNYFLERQLAAYGVEVHRFIDVSAILFDGLRPRRYIRHMLADAAPYLRYHIGADGTESVARTNALMKEGFDGMVHIKPFGCMPEVNAMSALQRLSRENLFPVLFISYDSQTSETGLQTRLEAFCDMLQMRKQAVA